MLLFLACHRVEAPPPQPPADLVERLGPGQARAGFVTDERALIGGISAEGRAGDLVLANHLVRFVVQGERDGHYYIREAGGVVDADIVRPEGQPGRELVDDWAVMAGVGRLMDASSFEVIDGGTDSGVAVVKVCGGESPLDLLVGVAESEGLVADLGLKICSEYTLEADSYLMEVKTTITATDGDALFAPGDILLPALDASDPWTPGLGLAPASTDVGWAGIVGKRGELAMAIFSASDTPLRVGGASVVLGSLVSSALGFGDNVTIDEGQSTTWTRYYGVGPDLAALTDEWQARRGASTETVSGVVQADDGPVAGARVNVLVDGAPFTLAITKDDGSFSAQVPSGAAVETLAVGRGRGLHPDHPAGWASYSYLAAEALREAALASLSAPGEGPAEAHGRGVGTPEDPLRLGVPAVLAVEVADGLPFEARLDFLDADPAVDEALVPGRADGTPGIGWARDGRLEMPVEPGRYKLTIHRGMRWSALEQEVQLVAGETLEVDAALELAVAPEGWSNGDPHQHSAPSGDGGCPMEDRVLVNAARGVQIPFSTDHDHVSDYRPLATALGLDDLLAYVVGSEISPVVRGHVNAWPLESDPEAHSGGAWPWYSDLVETTAEEFSILREWFPGAMLQSNHPLSSGIASAARWSPGKISAPDKWTEDFDAMEVLNDNDYLGPYSLYQDLITRGVFPTPTGVSDSHGHTSGKLGLDCTWLPIPVEEYSPERLREAVLARQTVVSQGIFLDLSITPGSEVVGPQTLDVSALAPPWVTVERVLLWKDGEMIEAVEGTEASFNLSPEADAVYTVTADSTVPITLSPYAGVLPWAMASAIFVDLAGDGWTPPKPPLELSEQ